MPPLSPTSADEDMATSSPPTSLRMPPVGTTPSAAADVVEP